MVEGGPAQVHQLTQVEKFGKSLVVKIQRGDLLLGKYMITSVSIGYIQLKPGVYIHRIKRHVQLFSFYLKLTQTTSFSCFRSIKITKIISNC